MVPEAKNFVQLVKYGSNSLGLLVIKLVLTWFLIKYFNPNLAYFFVQIILLFTSYFFHLKFTFNQKHSGDAFKRYVKAVILIKIFDYLIFSVAFVYFNIDALLAVVIATLIIFLVRFIFVKRALETVSPQDL